MDRCEVGEWALLNVVDPLIWSSTNHAQTNHAQTNHARFARAIRKDPLPHTEYLRAALSSNIGVCIGGRVSCKKGGVATSLYRIT